MMSSMDVEERIATIREALDELRAEDALDGFILIELDQLLDRLRDATEATTTSDGGRATRGQ